MDASPLTWTLWALGAVLATLLLVFALGPRLRALYREQFPETRRERQFLASIGFFLTFVIVRSLTHAIHAGRGPFHDISTASGLHIHHLVWGILLLLIVGFLWLLEIGTGVRGPTWLGRLTALLYGAGAALTLDEFALWLNLRDVYWEREGRESIGAIFLFGSLLSIGIWGAPLWRAVVLRLLGRGGGRHDRGRIPAH